jgi:transcriptional regulator with XRE-family HTH domain
MKRGQIRYRDWKDTGFPKWLQERMEDRGWNALRLSKEIGVVHSLITRWMTEQQRPSPESVLAVAHAFQIDEVEAMVAAGYLSPRREGAATADPPRTAELIRRLRATDLTHDRYQTLSLLLAGWAAADSQDTSERGE